MYECCRIDVDRDAADRVSVSVRWAQGTPSVCRPGAVPRLCKHLCIFTAHDITHSDGRVCVYVCTFQVHTHAGTPCAPAHRARPSCLTRMPWTVLRVPPHLPLSCLQERKQAWGTRQFQQYIGADVTSLLSVPVWIMEPFTILQKAAEIMEYTDLLDSADSTADPYDRLAQGGRGCRVKRGGVGRGGEGRDE